VYQTVLQVAPIGPDTNPTPRGNRWQKLFADCHRNDAGYQAGYNKDVNVGDGKRWQFPVPKKANTEKIRKGKEETEKRRNEAKAKLYTFLLQVLTCSCFVNEDEKLEIKEVNILYSEPQCQEQSKHHDLPKAFGDPNGKYGRWYSAIIPLRQNGGLVVWPGSHHHVRAGEKAHEEVYQREKETDMALDDGRVISRAWQIYEEDLQSKGMTPSTYKVVQREEIVVGSENCIVFDSLLLHAGARSQRKAGPGSFRLHAYFRVGPKGVESLEKDENSTFNVNKFAWRATSSCGCSSCKC
jgi:hypothetical protein